MFCRLAHQGSPTVSLQANPLTYNMAFLLCSLHVSLKQTQKRRYLPCWNLNTDNQRTGMHKVIIYFTNQSTINLISSHLCNYTAMFFCHCFTQTPYILLTRVWLKGTNYDSISLKPQSHFLYSLIYVKGIATSEWISLQEVLLNIIFQIINKTEKLQNLPPAKFSYKWRTTCIEEEGR